MSKLMGIDGTSLLYRAYYAMPSLTNREGLSTGAAYGFLNMLIRLMEIEQPTYMAVAFDLPGGTFRHDRYDDYKAGREETPDDLIPQFDMLKEVLTALAIPVLQKERYEADDILGYLAGLAREAGIEGVLVTGDNDVLQLAGDGVMVMLTKRGVTETERLDAEGVWAKMGVVPQRIPDLKGLMGDHSDHLPGVPGVGPKTAVKLLAEYGTIENTLAHAATIKGEKLRRSLQEFADQALLCRDLAVIDPVVPEMPALCDIQYHRSDMEDVLPALEKYGFASLVKRLGDFGEGKQGQADPDKDTGRDRDRDRGELPRKEELHDWSDTLCRGKQGGKIGVLLTDSDFLLEGESFFYCTPLKQTLIDEGMERQEILRELLPVFADPCIEIYVMDGKTWAHELAPLGGMMENDQDVMLAAYVCDPSLGKKDFSDLLMHYGIPPSKGAGPLSLYQKLEREMEENGLLSLYRDMELPLWRVLFDMETHGFRVDVSFLMEMSREYGGILKGLEGKIYRSAGKAFNINSPQQLGAVLFEDLQLPVVKTTAKRKGYSTDVEVLEQLSDHHEVVSWVLEYRKAAKLKSTYLDGLIAVADPNDHHVHTRFTQNVTATGRLSSIEPNLQNIPVRTEEGREIRKAFLPYAEDRSLVVADYSQIELRLLAHMSQDRTMCDIFNHDGDIHTDTAAQVFGVEREEVTGEMRSAAKAVNFGIVYGISDFGLAKNMGITRGRAAEYIETYFSRFSGIREYLDQSVADATQKGYAQTLFGRRRYIPELTSKNYNRRNFGRRVAMNAPIQGTAADIIKMAMIEVHRELSSYGEDAVLILQVHDELIVDCKTTLAEEIASLLYRRMEQVTELSIPLVVDVGIGKNWLDAK